MQLYSWDFDGAVPKFRSAAESVQFPAGGTYTVSLNIENGCNQSDQVSYEVAVTDLTML